MPDYSFESLREGSRSARIGHVDSTLLAVVNDVVFNFRLVSSEVTTLCGLRPRSPAGQRADAAIALGGQTALLGEARRTLSLLRSSLELLIHLLRDQGDCPRSPATPA
ncbi:MULTISPECIES: hypothetical protein [Pseudomonas aeruginosa group]|uniref:Cation transporter n=1 Tax=Pseudomonas paraeruginosa TaxID=2994495 RepID=A0A2R3IY77_9PSED|nr:putative cation transporter [Pseudomonas paraeruginosa]AWE89892.1 putative cation transporter [Pseudomonas paraeruginosa]KRU98446.1 hypothetical protein AN454_28165 [Pseudomonas aeruginosa]OES65402.1 hypothetical protein A7R81_03365 [Pseudomonas aeruginosa]